MAIDADARQLDTIYAAAWDPGALDASLRGLARACRSRSAGVYGLQDGTLAWEQSHNMPGRFMRAFAREAVPRDPRIAHALARPPLTLIDDSHQELRRSMQHCGIDRFARHYDLPFTFACMLARPAHGTVMALYVSRSASEGPPGNAELETFSRYAPHCARALQLRKRIRGDLASGAGVDLRTRGQVPTLGVLALDRHGRVRWLDGGAEHLLDECAGISLSGARLQYNDAGLAAEVARSLWMLGRGLAAPGEFVFRIPQACPPGMLRLRLLPEPADGRDRHACALVLLQRAFSPHPTGGDVAPTPRQGEVLLLMAQGLMSKQIAARLGISANTVRNHIGELLRSFGTPTRTGCVARARECGLID